MGAERRLTNAQLPTTWRPGALTSRQAKQQSNPQHQDGRARRAISCMLAGTLLCAPIWFMAYMGEHYRWEPHGIVVATAIGVMIAGLMWLYDEMFGY